MGMFDYLTCKYPLPLPLDLREAKDVDFNKLTYQTKDLECVMVAYEIREDGILYIRRCELEHVPGNPKAKSVIYRIGHMKTIKEWWEATDFTGTVNFYEGLHYSDESDDNWNNDYWVEYKATFLKGKVIEIVLDKWDIEDNTERKANSEAFRDEMEQRHILWNKWYMKYGYRFYDSFVQWVFIKWNRYKPTLPSAWKIERWLRPL